MDWFYKLLGIPTIDLGTSPREALLRMVLEQIVGPQDPRQIIEKTYGFMPIFLWFALALFALELGVRFLRAATGRDAGMEMRELFVTTVWLFGLIPLAPGIIAGIRVFANLIGSFMLKLFLGGGTVDEVVKKLGELTGKAQFDLFLSIIQIAGLMAMGLGLAIMIAAFAMSVIIVILGMSVRWMGDFGETALRGALRITLFSATINLILMVILGGVNAIGRSMYPTSPVPRGFMNTGAIIVASWVIWKAIQVVGSHVRAVASSAAQGYRKLRNRDGDENTSVDPDGDYHQRRSSQSGRRRQTEVMANHRESGDAQDGSKNSSRKSKPDVDTEQTDRETTQSHDEPPRRRGRSSTAGRSVRHSDRQPAHGDNTSTDDTPIRESSRRGNSRIPREHNRSMQDSAGRTDKPREEAKQ